MTAALAFLRAHWKLIGLSLLLSLLCIQQLRVAGLKSSLTAEKAGRAVDRKEYERAQMEATAKAFAAKIKKEAEYAQAAQAADADYDALRERYTGLLRNQGAGGASSGTAPAAQGGAAQVHEVAAAVPVGFRALPEADWLKLPSLQAYADGCYAWGAQIEAAQE